MNFKQSIQKTININNFNFKVQIWYCAGDSQPIGEKQPLSLT